MRTIVVASFALLGLIMIPTTAQASDPTDPTPVANVQVSVGSVTTNVGVPTPVKVTVRATMNPLSGGVLHVPVPDGLVANSVAISGTAGPTCSIDAGNDVTCTNLSLATNASRVVTITVTPAAQGEHVVAASLTATSGLIAQGFGRGATAKGFVRVLATGERDVKMRWAYAYGGLGGATASASAYNDSGIDTPVTVTITRTGTGSIASAKVGGVTCDSVTAAIAVCGVTIPAWGSRSFAVELSGTGSSQGVLDFSLTTAAIDVNPDDNSYPAAYSFDGGLRSVGFSSAYANSTLAGSAWVTGWVYSQASVPTDVEVDLSIDGPATITSASLAGMPCSIVGQAVECAATLTNMSGGNLMVHLSGGSTDAGVVNVSVSAPGYTEYYPADNTRSFGYLLDGVMSPTPPWVSPPALPPSAGSNYVSVYGTYGALRGTRLTFDASLYAYPTSIPGLTATISAPGASLAQPPAPLDDCTGVGTATLVCDIAARPSSYAVVPVVGTVGVGTKAVDVTVTITGGTPEPVSQTSRIEQKLGGEAGLRAFLKASGPVVLDGTNAGTSTLTLGAFNASATTAAGASSEITLPAGIEPALGDLPIGCAWTVLEQRLACELGSVPGFEYVSVDVPIVIAANLHGTRRLTATISATSGLGASADDVRRANLVIDNAAYDRVETTVDLSLPNLATAGGAWQPLSDHAAQVGERFLVRLDVSRSYLGAARAALNPTVVKLVLPTNVTYVTGEGNNSDAFACSAVGQVVTCPLGALAGSTSIRGTREWGTLDLLVDATSPGIGSLQAFVDDEQLATDEYTATETLLLEVDPSTAGDLSTRPAFVSWTANERARLAIPFHNVRTGIVDDAVATITLPAGVQLLGVAPSQGSCAGTAPLVCSLGDVPGGHGGVINLDVMSTTAGRYTLTTELSSSSTDPQPNNDVAQSVYVADAASFASIWGAPMTRLNVGTTATVKISGQVYPAGLADATVMFQLPTNVAFVAAGSAGCTGTAQGIVTCVVPKAQHEDDGVYTAAVTLKGVSVGSAHVSTWVTAPGTAQSNWNGGFSGFRVVVGAAGERDLVTALKVATSPVRVGDRTSIQFSVRNRSTLEAANAVATITLPAGLSVVRSGGPIDACSAAGQVLTCAFGTIPAGEYSSVDVFAQVDARPAGPITAAIAASGTDRDPSDDSDSAVLPTRGGGVGVDMLVEPRSACRVGVEESCVVVARVQNIGSSTASSATLVVDVPAQVDLEYWKVATSGTCVDATLADGTLTCPLGPVAAGAIVDVRLGVSPNAAGRFGIEYSVSSTGMTDPDLDNNEAAADVIGTGAAFGAAPASASFGSVGVGGSRRVDVTVSNLGVSAYRLVPQVGSTDAAAFTVDRGCHRVLREAGSCTVGVTFAPTAARAHAAELVLVDAFDMPLRTIPLAGTGIPTTTPVTEATVNPGDVVSTDPAGAGATAATPVTTQIVVPVAGAVTIQTNATPTTPAPTGYSLLGTELAITAPAATSASDPLRLVFTLDASAIPAGTDTSTIRVTRNGTPVTDACAGEAAIPSPCERSRSIVAGGDLQITVLTVAASSWSFARANPPASPNPNPNPNPNPTPDPQPDPKTDPLPTKLTGVVSRITKYRCTRREQRNGVLVGKVRWCFQLVTTAKLVEQASGRPVAGQQVRVARLYKRRTFQVGVGRTNAKGMATIKARITVPVRNRRTLAIAMRWIVAQYPRTTVSHSVSGTTHMSARSVTVVTRR